MKIRTKMILIMIVVVIMLLLGFIILNNTLIQNQMETERGAWNSAFARQVLRSFDLLSDQIEYSLFTNVTNERIPALLLDAPSDARRVNLQAKLQGIVKTQSEITDLFVIDLHGDIFSANGDPEAERTIHDMRDRNFFHRETDPYWTEDGGDKVFFIRQLNNIYPFQPAGRLIALIDTRALWAALGIEELDSSQIIIYNKRMEAVLVTDEHLLTSGGDRNEYLETRHTSENGEWTVVSLVRRSNILSSVRQFMTYTTVLGILMAMAAAVLSVALSYAITRNIDALVKRTVSLGEGDFKQQLPVRGRDEIAVLTRRFNQMSGSLADLNEKMLAEVEQRERIRYEMLEIQYRALQSRISPHFICNILTSVNALAISGEMEKVETLSEEAALYMRTNLRNSGKKFLPLCDELDSLQEYVRLYQQVFSAPFSFETDADEELLPEPVPSFLLQPLVENSIKYGMRGMKSVLEIRLTAKKTPEGLIELCIRDNGAGMDSNAIQDMLEGKNPGFGLSSVAHRLKLLYTERAELMITSVPYQETMIRITIPETAKMDEN